MNRMSVVMLGSVLLAGFCGSALAQKASYPTKPIRIFVAYTPAGATDILARAVGQKMTEHWGQPVIIENRPGAAGNIGTEMAARATPDGYTLIMATAGTHGINPSLYRNLSWDPIKSFDAGQPGRHGAQHHGRQQLPAGKKRQGADRLCQGQPRQTQLRLARHRQHRASVDGAVQEHDRHRPRCTFRTRAAPACWPI